MNFYYESKSTNSSLKEEQFYEEINEDFEKIIVARNFTVTVKFQKINKEWKITNNETLINALTGGYLEYQY